ncbi:hypothetical protein ACQ4PT_064169 [Festuca glaucescens]
MGMFPSELAAQERSAHLEDLTRQRPPPYKTATTAHLLCCCANFISHTVCERQQPHPRLGMAMEELKNLCKVLDSSYEETLALLNLEVDEEPDQQALDRMNAMVKILESVKQQRQSRLKVIGEKLLNLWKHVEVTPAQVLGCREAIACVDTDPPNEIIEAKYLSASSIKHAETQLSELQGSLRIKYESKKEKLLRLLNNSHLDIGQFNFAREENVVDYIDAIAKVKDQIKVAKAQAHRRREIVVRMEILHHYIGEKVTAHCSKGFMEKTRKLLDDFEGTFLYDGKLATDLFTKMELLVRGQEHRPMASALEKECHTNKPNAKKMCASNSAVEPDERQALNVDRTVEKPGEMVLNVDRTIENPEEMNPGLEKQEVSKNTKVQKSKRVNRELAALQVPTQSAVPSSRTRSKKTAGVEHCNAPENIPK